MPETIDRDKLKNEIQELRKQVGKAPYDETYIDSLSDEQLKNLHANQVRVNVAKLPKYKPPPPPPPPEPLKLPKPPKPSKEESKKNEEKEAQKEEKKADHEGKPGGKGFNKKLLIPVILIIIVALLFLTPTGNELITVLASIIPNFSQNGPILPTGTVSTKGQAILVAKANFTFYPEEVAETSVTEESKSWKVSIMIPGQKIIFVTVKKIDASVTTEMSREIHTGAVDSKEGAIEIVKYRMNEPEVQLSAISSDNFWLVQPEGKNFHYNVDKSTGITRGVSGVV